MKEDVVQHVVRIFRRVCDPAVFVCHRVYPSDSSSPLESPIMPSPSMSSSSPLPPHHQHHHHMDVYESEEGYYSFYCKNMNRRLAEEVGLAQSTGPGMEVEVDVVVSKRSYSPPETFGLENSPRIIPEYYLSTQTHNGILYADYDAMMLDDIRNLRPLNPYQLNYIEDRVDRAGMYLLIVEMNRTLATYACIDE